MANSDKNIVIIPNRNLPGQPNVVFTGNANVPITLRVADDNSLSFENVTGQLFSISNNVTSGSIFSVNDISGIPVINVDASGNISLSTFGGNVGIGTASPTSPLHVFGNIRIGNTSTISGVLFPDGTFQSTASSPGAFSASNVTVTSTTTNATFYPVFVESTTGNIGIRADSMWTFNPNTNQLSLTGNAWIQNSGSFGNVSITNTTASTSLTTGALTVAGGVGIAGSMIAGGQVQGANLNVTGSNLPTNGLYLPTTNTLGFVTNSTEKMRLTSTGGLSIGTSTGTNMLDVLGGVAVGNYAGNITTSANTVIVSGQVGIGTSNPSLRGTGTNLILAKPNSDSGLWIAMNREGISNVGIGASSGYMQFYVDNISAGYAWSINGNGYSLLSGYNAMYLRNGRLWVGAGGGSAATNNVDVYGNQVIGRNYAGVSSAAAPADGLAVQGQVGIGTSSVYGSAQLTVLGNVYTGNSAWIGNIAVTNTTASTSLTTGALTVAGGVGISGNLFAGSNVLATGSVGIGLTTYIADNPLSVQKSDTSTTIGGSKAVIKVNNPGGILSSTTGIEFFETNDVNSNIGRLAGIYGLYKSYNASGLGGELVFATNTAGDATIDERMRITATGLVGIGTTITNALLDVGTFNTSNPNIITGSLEFQPFSLNNAFIGENVYYDGSKFAYRRTGAAGLFYFAGAEGGFRWALSGTAGANAGMASYQLKTASDGTFAVGPAVSGSAGVYTGATLFVNPTGQVGIGTSSVYGSAQLTVIGNVYTESSAWIGNLVVTNTTASTSSTTGALTVAGGVGVAGSMIAGGLVQGANLNVTGSNLPSNGLYLPTANTLGFATNSTEKMRINSSGNVGIGLTNPLATLHSGNSLTDANFTFSTVGAIITSKVTNQRSAQSNVLVLSRSGQSGIVYAGLAMFDMSAWQFDSVWARTQLDIKLSNTLSHDLTNVITFRSDGRVGIGSSVPAQTLDVVGTVAISSNLTVGGTIFGVVNTAINASNIVVTSTATNATFYPAFVEATSGNIGIRAGSSLTFNPSTNQLSLTGNAAIQNSLSAGNLSVTNTTVSTSTTSGALTVAGGVGVAGNVFAGSNMLVAGQVGIGTTLPASTLYVAGKQIISNVFTSNTMVYTGKSLDVNAQEAGPGNPFFSPDGKLLYFTGTGGNDVTVFTLTIPWDISTATFVGQSASLAAQNGNPFGLVFDPTGKKMWMSGFALTNNMYGIYEYDLAIPWNIFPNSLSYNQSNLNVTSSNNVPRQIIWKPDGTALFLVGSGTGTYTDSVMEFSPVAPWTIAGMSNTVVNSFSVAGQESNPTGLNFTNDGSTMLIIGSTGDDINVYDLSTPWNITTARHRTQYSLSSLVSNITVPTGTFLKPDGSAIYVTNDVGSGTGNCVIYQFDLGNNSRFDLVGNAVMSGDVLMLQNATVAGQLTGWQANFNGNVGIGTTTPTQILDVAGSALFRSNVAVSNTIAATSTTSGALTVAGGVGVAGNIYVGGTLFGVANASVNASNIVVTNTSTNATFYPTFVEATSGNIGVRTGSSLTFNPNTNQLSLTGNTWIQNGGRFGNLSVTNTTASTSSTTGALTVAGGVGVAGNAWIANATIASNGSLIVQRSATQYLQISEFDSDTAPYIRSYSAPSNAKGITYDARTDTAGSAVTAGALNHYFMINGSTVLLLNQSGNAAVAYNDSTAAMRLTGGFGLSGSIQALGALNAINANINSSSSTVPINGIWSPAANTLGFSTGGSERARIDSNGNLSIGTSTSTWNTVPARASVFGAKDLTNSAGGAGDQLAIVDSSTAAQGVGGGINLFGNYTGTTQALGAMIDTYKSNSTAGNFGFDLRFHTRLHNTALIQERMRITSTGLVGIGSTSPTQTLEVQGTTLLKGNISIVGNIYTASSTQVGNLSITNTTVSTSSTTGALIVQGGVGVVGNVFVGRISTANSGEFGNVGINNTTASTSSTTGALTVAGGVGVANGIIVGGNVGIGTSTTTGYTNNALAVFGRALNRGNIYVTNSSTISGIMFSDGTFQNTAAYRSAQTVISYTTANSSTTTFSSSPYTSANSYVQLYVNGVYQPSAYYTWSGTTVTTTTPAPNGAVVELVITTASTLTTSVTFAQTLAAVSLRL